MSKAPFRILLVEDDPTDVLVTKTHLSRADDFYHQVEACGSLAQALEVLGKQSYDACLLDLNLPDSKGSTSVAQITQADPAMAVVVLTNFKDKEMALAATKVGAQDYLIKTELDSNRLATALLLARERHKFLHGELDTLARFPFGAQASTTMRLYAQGPLNQTQPEIITELTRVYAQILDEAVELSPFGEQPDNYARMQTLAENLGRAKAGPKDLIDIHTKALQQLSEGSTIQKMEALSKEGRLLLVQAMGFLVMFYRKYCHPLPNAGPEQETCAGDELAPKGG